MKKLSGLVQFLKYWHAGSILFGTLLSLIGILGLIKGEKYFTSGILFLVFGLIFLVSDIGAWILHVQINKKINKKDSKFERVE